jgi:two-component system alkaline phosphatase synthesis response regulator PhoP
MHLSPTAIAATHPVGPSLPRRLLIIEDNRNLARGLRHNFELEGYEVEVCHDGASGLAAARAGGVDLILLDLMIPRPDGHRILHLLRQDGIETPVIVVTARGEEMDKLRGFRLGADDYVTKPFSVLELIARASALLRRSRAQFSPAPDELPIAGIEFGTVRIEPETHSVYRDGEPVSLRPREFQLLMALVRRGGRVATRTELLNEVWGYDADVVSRTVDTHIGELRRKLEDDPAAPQHLVTVRKTGYRLAR